MSHREQPTRTPRSLIRSLIRRPRSSTAGEGESANGDVESGHAAARPYTPIRTRLDRHDTSSLEFSFWWKYIRPRPVLRTLRFAYDAVARLLLLVRLVRYLATKNMLGSALRALRVVASYVSLSLVLSLGALAMLLSAV